MKKINNLLIYFVVFLLPLYFFRFSIFGIRTNIFEVGVLVAFLIFIYSRVTDYTIRHFKMGTIWPYLFLVSAFIAVIWSPDKEKALGIAKGWFLVPIMFYWLIVNIFNDKTIYKLSLPFFLSLQIVSIWALLQKLGIISTLLYQSNNGYFAQYLSDNFRAFGPFESPNYLAMFIVPSIFISLPVLHLLKNHYLKILFGASYVIPVLAVYFSRSRGGFAALVISFLTFVLVILIKNQK